MKNIFLFFALLLLSLVLQAQPATRSKGILNCPDGYFVQYSRDYSKMAFPGAAIHPSGKEETRVFAIYDFKDFSQQSITSFERLASLNSGLAAMYYNDHIMSEDSTQANFRLYYSARDGRANLQLFDGKYYTLGLTKEGYLICGDGQVYMDRSSGSNYSLLRSLKNLRIVNPENGAVVKTLYKGSLLEISEGRKQGLQHTWMLNSDQTLLVRTGGNPYIVRVFPFDGRPAYNLDLPGIFEISDTIARCSDLESFTFGGKRMRYYSLITGQKLVDTTYDLQKKQGSGAGVFVNNHIFIFEAARNIVDEFEIRDGKLNLVRSYPLKMAGVELPSSPYRLVVSPVASRIVLYPSKETPFGQNGNQAYIWDMATGDLLHMIYPFVKGCTRLPKDVLQQYCQEELVSLKMKPGTFIERDGTPYYVKAYDCVEDIYEIEWAGGSATKHTKGLIELFFKPCNAQVCPQCNGYGSETKRVTTTTTDVDNYNAWVPGGKVITTRKKTTNKTETCGRCNGQGITKL